MKAAALISGGVDSSVALCLAQDARYDVQAFYLKVWLEDELEYLGQCPWEEDLEYARAVCDALDVELRVVPVQQHYWQRVIDFSLAEIRAGRTPNPDMLCNSRVKFGAFFDAIDSSFEAIVTGHYAGTRVVDDLTYLTMTPDPVKDQTYFLAHLSQSQIKRARFPLGDLKKEEVRAKAADFNLPTRDRPDSQGLCFLGKISFRDFVRHHLGEKNGDIVEYESGQILGEHQGYWFYTIGQRQGLGLSGGPWYVVAKDHDANRVFVSRDYYAEDKSRDRVLIGPTHWIARPPSQKVLRTKLRHGEKMYDCTLESQGDGRSVLHLNENDQGIAPGQYAVLYEDDVCLGCGMILGSSVDAKQGEKRRVSPG